MCLIFEVEPRDKGPLADVFLPAYGKDAEILVLGPVEPVARRTKVWPPICEISIHESHLTSNTSGAPELLQLTGEVGATEERPWHVELHYSSTYKVCRLDTSVLVAVLV